MGKRNRKDQGKGKCQSQVLPVIDNKKEEKEEEGVTEDETQLLAYLKYANATYFQTPLKFKGQVECKDKCKGQGQFEVEVESVPKLYQGSSEGTLSFIKKMNVLLFCDFDMPQSCTYVDNIGIRNPPENGDKMQKDFDDAVNKHLAFLNRVDWT